MHFSAILAITQEALYVRVCFWILCSLPFVVLPLYQHHTILITGFIMSFDKWYGSSSFAFLQWCHGHSWSFVFPYIAQNHLQNFYQSSQQASKTCRGVSFDWYLYTIESSNPRPWWFSLHTLTVKSLAEAGSNSDMILLSSLIFFSFWRPLNDKNNNSGNSALNSTTPNTPRQNPSASVRKPGPLPSSLDDLKVILQSRVYSPVITTKTEMMGHICLRCR